MRRSKKRSLLDVNEHFSSKHNAKIALLGDLLLVLVLAKLCQDTLSRLWVKERDSETLSALTRCLVDKTDAVCLSVSELLLDVLASESHVVDTSALSLKVLSDC